MPLFFFPRIYDRLAVLLVILNRRRLLLLHKVLFFVDGPSWEKQTRLNTPIFKEMK